MQNKIKNIRYSNIPFPKEKYIPGLGEHRKDLSSNTVQIHNKNITHFDPENWIDSQQYLYAIDLFNFGYWWEAHEVLEELWIQTGRTTKTAKFIQGIIQISASLIKDYTKMNRAASVLVKKGISNLKIRHGIFIGINVNKFVADIEMFFEKKNLIPPRIILLTSDEK